MRAVVRLRGHRIQAGGLLRRSLSCRKFIRWCKNNNQSQELTSSFAFTDCGYFNGGWHANFAGKLRRQFAQFFIELTTDGHK